MATEALEKIRFAEENAEKIEQAAKLKTEKVIEEANLSAQKIVKDAKAHGEELLKNRVDEALKSAEEISKNNENVLKEELLKLDEYADKMKDEAIALIKKKLIS